MFLGRDEPQKQRMTSPKTDKRLEEMLKSAYGKTWEDRSSVEKELAKYKDLVLSCCERKHLVSNALGSHTWSVTRARTPGQ